jgi:hypothetical protein
MKTSDAHRRQLTAPNQLIEMQPSNVEGSAHFV